MRAPVSVSHHLLSAVVLLVPVVLLASAIAAHIRHTPEAEAAAVATLQGVAANTSMAMDKYMLGLLNQVLTLARVPAVRKQVDDSNALPFDDAVAQRWDAEWQERKGPPPPLEWLLETEGARFLRDLACPPEAECALLGVDEVGSMARPRLANRAGVLREVVVADRFGRLALASNPTSDYLQAGEEWFERVRSEAKGCAKHVSTACVHTGRAEHDESAQSYGFDFAVPVQAESGAVTGVLKALVDLEDIVAVLQAIQPPGMQAAFVDSKGDAIYVEQKARVAFARGWVQEHLKRRMSVRARSEKAESHVVLDADARGTDTDDQQMLVVLSANPLRVQNGWSILVWQSRAAALAPVSQQIWTTVTMVTVALILAIAVAIQIRAMRSGKAGTQAAKEPPQHPEEVSNAMPH